MVGELETQQVGGFAHVVPVHQQILALFDHEGMDVADGRAAGGLVDDVAQIAGRVGQLSGAISDGRDSEVQLSAIQIVLPQKAVEPLQDIGGGFVFLRKLALIDAIRPHSAVSIRSVSVAK